MESSAMAVDPHQPVVQSDSLEHNITSIDNHWQDLEIVPFSSSQVGNEQRQQTGVDVYDFEQHAQKYFGEVHYNGSQHFTGSKQAVEPRNPSSMSSSGVPSGVRKMQPRQRQSQGKLSPRSANPENHSLPSVTARGSTVSNQLTKIQNRLSGDTGIKKVTANKRVKQTIEPPPPTEPLAESSGSVRLKMRESLAAALKLASDEGNSVFAVEGKETLSAAKDDGLDTTQEGAKLGDREVGQSVGSSANEAESLTEVSAETDIQKSGGANTSTVLSDISDMKKDQSSSRLTVASNVDYEECEDKEVHIVKKLKLADALDENASQTPQGLAAEIEGELYRLFGGVNKKYKEKGRSLLFNLKDRHNPELRKRVFFGEIGPVRLCSMTAEELASKELTQWRIAKAEERAQMVVLHDSNRDFKSFVKKTHKGEVEVEVERYDSAPVEVVLAGNVFSQLAVKSRRDASTSEQYGSDAMLFDNMASEQHQNTDLMLDLIGEEFRDSNSISDIPTLDEFMKDLDEEPPFQNMLIGAVQRSPASEKVAVADRHEENSDAAARYSEATVAISPETTRNMSEFKEKSAIKLDLTSTPKSNFHSNIEAEHTDTGPIGQATGVVPCARGSADVNSYENDASRIANGGGCTSTTFIGRNLSSHFASSAVNGEHVWEGLIQLNISSLVTALGFYRSGARASMKEWPTFLEIKGRVRLDSFDKFLQDLRSCRSRAIMV